MKRHCLLVISIFAGILIVHSQAHDICKDPITKKYGVCYADTIRVPQIYDFGQYINSHEFILAKDGKYGVCDRDGNWIIEMIYDHIWEFTELSNQLLVRTGEKYGIVNLHGKEIVPMYELQPGEINTFHIDEHLSFAHSYDDFQVIKDGKMAVYNMEGKRIFDFIYPFVQDILVTPTDTKKNPYYIFLVGENGKYSFVDARNKPIFKNIVVDDMYNVYHAWGSHTKGIKVNNKISFINVETGVILSLDEMSDMLESFNMVQNLTDKIGAIGADGKFRVPCIYTNMVELTEVDYSLVEIDRKEGLINDDGDVFIDPIYIHISEICVDAQDPTLFPYIVDNGRWSAIFVYDSKVKKMVPKTEFMFSDITCFEQNKEGVKAYLTDSIGRKGLLLENGTIQMNK